jgi:hypothetical protein
LGFTLFFAAVVPGILLRKGFGPLKEGKMKLNKRYSVLAGLLVCVALAGSAAAIPVGGALDAEHTEIFNIAGAAATVDCRVYAYDSAPYVYTYQISNESLVGISFFSVGIIPDATAFDPAWDVLPDTVSPANWDTAGSPVESVNALFVDTIENDGLPSALLSFKSDMPAIMGSGVLFGSAAGVPISVTGSILTPRQIPEPATVVLLGLGTAVLTLAPKRSPKKP